MSGSVEAKKRKGGRHKRGQFFIYEYTCIGCGEAKSWGFLDKSDFEQHVLAQNDCCPKCYLEGDVTEEQINNELPVIKWRRLPECRT